MPFLIISLTNHRSFSEAQQNFDSHMVLYRGGTRHFHLGGATGGDSFATRGAANGLCRTFRKTLEKFWGGHWGG